MTASRPSASSTPAAPGAPDPASVAGVVDALGLTASPGQIRALVDYLALLARWNGVYNLTAVRDPQAMLTQHVADSLSIVAPLRRDATARRIEAGRVLDVGSGGGLPGIPLAVMQPDWSITCVEPVGKKAAFIRQAAGELGLGNLDVQAQRAERLTPPPTYDWITSRAFGSLELMVESTRRLLASGGCWVAMKGLSPTAEIDRLAADVSVFHVEPLEVPGLQGDRCLVWMRPVKA